VLVKLAAKSLLQRRVSVLLTVMMIAISVFVLLSVDTIRYQAKDSFSKTVSGVDLIIGARTGQLNLLLYSVFHIGNATNNISWQSYQQIANSRNVAWTIPISLGDSHRGYRVVGTTTDLFKYFKYGQQQPLEFKEGQQFEGLYDAVIGADVAKKLGYKIGSKIVLSHGIAATSFSKHDDKPFIISGVLKPTGTPIDKTVYVSLQAIEAIHVNWTNGVKLPSALASQTAIDEQSLTPKSITAFMVGLKSKLATFALQRQVNTYLEEPLQAILPGATLVELWQMLGSVEQILLLISVLVLAGALFGMSNMLLVSMKQRQHEMAVLRAVGASPIVIFLLIQLEAMLLVVTGVIVAVLALWMSMQLFRDYIISEYGLFINQHPFSAHIMQDLGWVLLVSFVIAMIPAISAYRHSLHTHLR
jgi:putative ABC transport system permease protein